MHYDIRLGFLAADAISEFSRAAQTKEVSHYENFLEHSRLYCHEFRTLYSGPREADITTSMPVVVADFMRAVVKSQQPSPAIVIKLETVDTVEKLLEEIREQQRSPSDAECLRIAKAIYATSAAESR